jgi:hypothetical protein
MQVFPNLSNIYYFIFFFFVFTLENNIENLFDLSHKKTQNVFARFERRDEIFAFREKEGKQSLESDLNDNQLGDPMEANTEALKKNESDIEDVKELEHSKSERISDKFDSNPDINYKEEEESENKTLKPENEGKKNDFPFV